MLRQQGFDLFRPIVRQGHAVFADGGCPNRGGKVGIVFEAGDDVPMQVGHNIAEAGQIDFGRVEDLAHCGFNLIHHFHDFGTFGS